MIPEKNPTFDFILRLENPFIKQFSMADWKLHYDVISNRWMETCWLAVQMNVLTLRDSFLELSHVQDNLRS